MTFSRYLTAEEERRLLGTVAGRAGLLARRDHAWMRLLRHTGIRVGSLHGLDVADAREALRTGYLELRPEITKRSQRQRIRLIKQSQSALRDLLRIRREQGHPDVPDAPLVCSRNHRRMSVRSFEARMVHWRDQSGLSMAVTPHWFRHTLAKRIMRQSTSIDPRGIAKCVLGHRSIASTGVYTEPDREDVEQALEEASA